MINKVIYFFPKTIFSFESPLSFMGMTLLDFILPLCAPTTTIKSY